MSDVKKIAQGPATLLTAEEQKLDDHGFTNPNLHTRIEPHAPEKDSGEVRERSYDLTVQNVNSYRTTKKYYHDEESTDSETP